MALTINLFGPMVVLVDEQPFPRLHNRRALWLLALLVLRQGRPVERDWLAGMLWPDADQDQALGNLRPILSALRQALGSESERLHSPNRHTLSLDLTGAIVDVQAFDARIALKTLPALAEAVEFYSGPLLEGCTEEWVPQERRAREENCLQALQTLAKAALTVGEHQTAAQYCRRAIDIAPQRDEAQRLLMTALDSAGDCNAAQQVYRDFAQFLRRDLQAIPEKETSALYARLRSEAKRRAMEPFSPIKRGSDSRVVPIVKGHLPHPLTEIVGREDERLDVAEKLWHSRLVTLTGPGGIGKTRLSVEVAAQAVGEFSEGAWLVPLEALSDGAQVAGQIAVALGLKEEPGQPVLESLVRHLRPRKLLLVLDNCEHLLAACAPVVATLLHECAQVRILATSREPFGIPGEMAWAVPTLTTPEPQHLPTSRATLLRVLMSYESVQLFVERAQAVQRTFALDATNALDVAQVCTQLAGIPLAIELAAARINVLSAAQIVTRLKDQLSLLTSSSRVAPLRHQTLRAALDWSYGLLSAPEQTLLRHLSVFSGGWSLDAAEAVCACDGIEAAQVLDLLASLASKSLVLFEPLAWREKKAALGHGGASSRYRLLETVRQYAAERLLAGGETDRTRVRHRDYFLALAEESATEMRGPNQEAWIWRLESELDNLRTALAWDSPTPQDAEAGLRFAIALSTFWNLRCYLSEGRQHLKRLLARTVVAEAASLRAKALNSAGTLANRQGDRFQARSLHEEALAIFRSAGNRSGIAHTLNSLGNLADPASGRPLYEESLAIHRELDDSFGIATTIGNIAKAVRAQGDYGGAHILLEESLERFRALGDKWNVGRLLGNLGSSALIQGDAISAVTLLEEGLSIRRELGDQHGIAWSLSALGEAANALGKHSEAKVFCEEALSISREIGDSPGEVGALLHLGETAIYLGNLIEAHALLEDSLHLFQNLKDRMGTAWALYRLGVLAGAVGTSTESRTLLAESLSLFREPAIAEGLAACLGAIAAILASSLPDKAVCLWGASHSLKKNTGVPMPPNARAEYERQISGARSALGEATFDLAWEQGVALTREQAVEYALRLVQETHPITVG